MENWNSQKSIKKQHPTTTDNQGRANNRVQQILRLLNFHNSKPFLKSILDVGCAEGSITRYFSEALHLPPERVHGCDIREVKTKDGFTFKKLDPMEKHLPYASNSQSLITALMAIHH